MWGCRWFLTHQCAYDVTVVILPCHDHAVSLLGYQFNTYFRGHVVVLWRHLPERSESFWPAHLPMSWHEEWCTHRYSMSIGHLVSSISNMAKLASWQLSGFGDFGYRQASNISRFLLGNKIVDLSDVVGASPVGVAPTTSSFRTEHHTSMN